MLSNSSAMLRVLAAVSVLCCGVVSQAPEEQVAGHSGHGEAFNEGPRQSAYLMAGCGTVSFPVSCKRELAQKFFDQGVGQLHGFWHFEAERSFRQVAALESDCAMAYWGMAMANVDNPNRAAGFIEAAVQRRDSATAREQLWIDGLAKYYEVTRSTAEKRRKDKPESTTGVPASRKFKGSKKQRSRDLVRSYEKILELHPDDIEASAFLANRMWLNRRAGLPTNSHHVIDVMLRQVFEKNPMHPAHHYQIHLWDREDARRALSSAVVSGQASPAIAHQWHMSGHIFAKLHRHEDAVWQQSASARVDHAHMMRDRVMPHAIHNYGHNNEWLVRSLNHSGMVRRALALARNMVEQPRHPKDNRLGKRSSICGYGTSRLIDTCRNYLLLPQLKELHDSDYFAVSGDERAVLRVAADLGSSYFMLGDVARGKRQLATVRAVRAAVELRAAKKPKKSKKESTAEKPKKKSKAKGSHASKKQVARRVKELEALLALAEAEGGKADAGKLLKGVRLPKMLLADCHLAAGDSKQARKLIDAEAKRRPDRAEIMARQVRILWACGDRKRARQVFDRLREVAGNGDTDVPLFARLLPIAKEFNYPADWRSPRETSTDVGARPDLDGLGPFRWAPTPADDWELPSIGGKKIALQDFRGRPTLVIFYLGFGCLHCVEQLQHFHPMADEYRKAGIEIVAIGTDSVAGMSASLASMSPADRFAYPLVSDESMRVFKQWRAYDDFEAMPLHGTFLVDGAGMVRWRDVSYEPFDRPRWLLAECKRLLRQKL